TAGPDGRDGNGRTREARPRLRWPAFPPHGSPVAGRETAGGALPRWYSAAGRYGSPRRRGRSAPRSTRWDRFRRRGRESPDRCPAEARWPSPRRLAALLFPESLRQVFLSPVTEDDDDHRIGNAAGHVQGAREVGAAGDPDEQPFFRQPPRQTERLLGADA